MIIYICIHYYFRVRRVYIYKSTNSLLIKIIKYFYNIPSTEVSCNVACPIHTQVCNVDRQLSCKKQTLIIC